MIIGTSKKPLGDRPDSHSLMNDILLQSDSITLAQALKVAGLADTGGQAKHLIRSGIVTLNDRTETQPSRKLVEGDRFRVEGGAEWTVRR